MEGVIALLGLGVVILLAVAVEQLFTGAVWRRLAVLLNLVVWGYEVFFFVAVCGWVPRAEVHFGGGLGDWLSILMLAPVIVAHIVVIGVMAHKKTVRAGHLLLPLIPVCLVLMAMHLDAAWGNERNGHMTGGNWRGLYYDPLDRQEREYRNHGDKIP